MSFLFAFHIFIILKFLWFGDFLFSIYFIFWDDFNGFDDFGIIALVATMGVSIHAQDTSVMSSRTISFSSISSNSVCPNFSFVDVSHASTSMS